MIANIEYVIIYCANCGIPFCITRDLYDRLRACHNAFYCPRGHSQNFRQESDLEREKRLRQVAMKERDDMGLALSKLRVSHKKLVAELKKANKPPAPRKARQ